MSEKLVIQVISRQNRYNAGFSLFLPNLVEKEKNKLLEKKNPIMNDRSNAIKIIFTTDVNMHI